MMLRVTPTIRLELITDHHALPIFDMVNNNRNYLRTWLPFVDRMLTVDVAMSFVKGTQERNRLGTEYAFVIYENDEPVGRIGVYKVDLSNRIGEIGYWLIEHKQGKGIVTQACQTMIDFCFDTLNLNRIELKCGIGNTRSIAIPQRFGFKHEGVIHDGEWLHDHYIDLALFAFLKKNRKPSGLS